MLDRGEGETVLYCTVLYCTVLTPAEHHEVHMLDRGEGERELHLQKQVQACEERIVLGVVMLHIF